MLVKTQVIGTAVASVTVTDAFSATYDNYKILLSGGSGSTIAQLALKLGSTTTGYYAAMFGAVFSSGAFSGAGTNNGSSFPNCGLATGIFSAMNIELLSPNLAKVTNINSGFSFNTANNAYAMMAGELSGTTQYTDFTITPASGTLTGGTIRVYGYANS